MERWCEAVGWLEELVKLGARVTQGNIIDAHVTRNHITRTPARAGLREAHSYAHDEVALHHVSCCYALAKNNISELFSLYIIYITITH